MTESADELVKKSVAMRNAGRIEEAIIVAMRATAVNPHDANTWWQLGLALEGNNESAAAIPHFRKTVELKDGFAYGWHQLGATYRKSGMLNEAIESWEKTIQLDDDRLDTLNELAGAYRRRGFEGDEDRLFEVLKLLDAKGKIGISYLNILGIGYTKRKEYYKAIDCFRRFARADNSAVGYFNLGLALIAPQIRQDADAVDCWRRALERDPTHERTQEYLKKILPRLIELKHRILTNGEELIDGDQRYLNYINPFELLNLTDVENVVDLEIKKIQKAKSMLIQEIQLEDGLVEWVPGLSIDKSQAIKVTDGLTDLNERYWHYAIYEDKPLLDFISRGSIRHFLVDEKSSARAIVAKIEERPGEFEALVGDRFAAQFNLVLTKAIANRNINAIDAILDGRRWVSRDQEEKCFEGAIRKIDQMIEPLRRLSKESEVVKPSVDAVRAILAKENLDKIIRILPTPFESVQKDAADIVRSISINANNHHNDPALAKQIMELGKPLAPRSQSFMLKIDEDTKILDELIETARIAEEAERIDQLLEPLREALHKSETRKPRFEALKDILVYGNLRSILLGLPTPLWHLQNNAASIIRNISVNANNHHNDPALAKNILALAKSVLSISSEFHARINEDMVTLENRIRDAEEANRIDRILEPLRQASVMSEKVKPRFEVIKDMLAYRNLATVLKTLPEPLNHFQDEAASLIRGIAIGAYNHHGDADLAKDVLKLGKNLLRTSSDLNVRLEEDMKTLDDRIRDESKAEASLIYQGLTYNITRKAVSFGSQRLAVEDVRTLRWGITITRAGTVANHTFIFVVGGKGSSDLTLCWSSDKGVEAQMALFNKFVNASFAYLLPRVIETIQSDLDCNKTIHIGSAPVNRQGVTFTIEGLFSNKLQLCPWNRLRSEILNGDVVITDSSNIKCRFSLPLAAVDNAIALHAMINNQS